MMIQINLLADHPEFIDTLAPWVWQHWRALLDQDTLEDRVARFRKHLNRDTLPIAWVAHDGGQVMGTAALRVCDLPGREDLTPWLSGVYVAPQFRQQGIGQALSQALAREAHSRFGTSQLYLFTLDRQAWYAGFGWESIESCHWCGHAGDIMVKQLPAPALQADPAVQRPQPPLKGDGPARLR